MDIIHQKIIIILNFTTKLEIKLKLQCIISIQIAENNCKANQAEWNQIILHMLVGTKYNENNISCLLASGLYLNLEFDKWLNG